MEPMEYTTEYKIIRYNIANDSTSTIQMMLDKYGLEGFGLATVTTVKDRYNDPIIIYTLSKVIHRQSQFD